MKTIKKGVCCHAQAGDQKIPCHCEDVQYSEKIDEVIYGDATGEFTKADWIDLAWAALDQAGILGSFLDDMKKERDALTGDDEP